MKTRILLLLTFVFFVSSGLDAQKIFNKCPLEGKTSSDRIKKLNRDKNRYTLPTQDDLNADITLEKILQPGDDEDRFHNNEAVEITGYVINVKKGGIETCNCKAKEAEFRDTHIEMVLRPNQTDKSDRFIVEVTPRIRKKMKDKGIDWSTNNLKDILLHKWVKIQGWMFYDDEHWYNAYNTNPEGENVWRATAWEIHPITSIEIIPEPQ